MLIYINHPAHDEIEKKYSQMRSHLGEDQGGDGTIVITNYKSINWSRSSFTCLKSKQLKVER